MNKYIAVEQLWHDDNDVEHKLYWVDETMICNLPTNITPFKVDDIPNLQLYTMYRCIYNIFTGIYTIYDEIYTEMPHSIDPIYPVKYGVLYTDRLVSIKPSKNEAVVACQEMATQVLKNDPVVDTSNYFSSCPYKWISRTYLENNDWVWIDQNKHASYDFKTKKCTIDGIPYKPLSIPNTIIHSGSGISPNKSFFSWF